MSREHIVRSYDETLDSLTRKILEMGGYAETQVAAAVEAFVRRDADQAADVVRRDERVDRFEEEIDQHAVLIFATRQPVAVDLRLVAMALKISNDLERISDHAKNIARGVGRHADLPPARPPASFAAMGQIVQEMIKDVLDAYVARDAARALAVWHRDAEVDGLYDSAQRELLTYMLEDPRNITGCLEFQATARHLERIGDHATNIAEKVHYVVHGRTINRLPREATGLGETRS